MEPGAKPGGGATVVAPPPAERALVWVGFPLIGAAAGWLLKSLAEWATSLPWVPFQGPLELVASVPDPQATIGSLALGVAGGLVVAVLAEQDYVRVTVEDDQLTVTRGGSSRRVPRASVEAVFLDGKQLVLLGHETDELVREGGDLPDAERLQAAFRAHGYPWVPGGDPHKDEYRRWVEDLPDLPAGADAVLKARARALDRGDKEDAAQLRQELGKLGIVVRDEGKRQFWRRTRPGER
ncbi:MAG TPA: hypothetical protein VFL71_01340 [Actinomycetes bacterium]|nr:hypothetical protein [Actinomycetes bacterium]